MLFLLLSYTVIIDNYQKPNTAIRIYYVDTTFTSDVDTIFLGTFEGHKLYPKSSLWYYTDIDSFRIVYQLSYFDSSSIWKETKYHVLCTQNKGADVYLLDPVLPPVNYIRFYVIPLGVTNNKFLRLGIEVFHPKN